MKKGFTLKSLGGNDKKRWGADFTQKKIFIKEKAESQTTIIGLYSLMLWIRILFFFSAFVLLWLSRPISQLFSPLIWLIISAVSTSILTVLVIFAQNFIKRYFVVDKNYHEISSFSNLSIEEINELKDIANNEITLLVGMIFLGWVVLALPFLLGYFYQSEPDETIWVAFVSSVLGVNLLIWGFGGFIQHRKLRKKIFQEWEKEHET